MPVTNNQKIFTYVYQALQTKQVHVAYTAEKATRLYTRMTAAAAENELAAEGLTGLVNQMHAMRGRIQGKIKTGMLTSREKRYGNKVIALLGSLIEENEKIQKKAASSANLMRCASGSLQVTVFKAMHYQWREKVYMSVLSGPDDFPLEDEYHCSLGRWYNSERSQFFRLQSGYIRLGDAHTKLHRVAEELLQECRRAEPSQERIIKKLGTLETLSLAVIAALDELDDDVIRLGQSGDLPNPVGE